METEDDIVELLGPVPSLEHWVDDGFLSSLEYLLPRHGQTHFVAFPLNTIFADVLDLFGGFQEGLIAMKKKSRLFHKALEAIVERMRARSQRGEAFPELDREFHHCLFEPARNSVILRMLDIFWVTHRRASQHLEVDEPARQRVYEDHVAILDAVRDRDVQAAKQALSQHYAVAEKRVASVQASLGRDSDKVDGPTVRNVDEN